MKMMCPKKTESIKYIETLVKQFPKSGQEICGDVFEYERNSEATTVILCDGLGSGVKANLAAIMCASRLKELIRLGFSIRHACEKVVQTMHKARTSDIPFSAFTVVKILKDGYTTIISYEMPQNILIEENVAYVNKPRFSTLGSEVIAELNLMLKTNHSLLLVSDGVSQAGLGQTYKMGWTVEKMNVFINSCLHSGCLLKDIPGEITLEARKVSLNRFGDDTSVVMLNCRQATVVNIFTGPSETMNKDEELVKKFMKVLGKKIVCGSTTAEIFSRVLHKTVKLANISQGYHQPPQYQIEGLDIVTEGAITLNQVYNIIDEQWDTKVMHSTVMDMCVMLKKADCINFWVGKSSNAAHQDLIFKQMNILPRMKVVNLLADKLRLQGKLVTIQYF